MTAAATQPNPDEMKVRLMIGLEQQLKEGSTNEVTATLHPSWISEFIQKKCKEGYLVRVKRLKRSDSKRDTELRTYKIKLRKRKQVAA